MLNYTVAWRYEKCSTEPEPSYMDTNTSAELEWMDVDEFMVENFFEEFVKAQTLLNYM